MRVAKNFGDYVRGFPPGVRKRLVQLRLCVRKAAPNASERISYGMPAFFMNRNLVYFAGYAKHIGFYPGAGAVAAFKKDISGFKHAKGSVQFPLNRALPLRLVTQMVKFRIKQMSVAKKR